jgi:hypothetical protein
MGQCHENEIHIDQDGKKMKREIWHNIAHDESEKSNLE